MIYLDNSTAAKPSERAISAMMPYYNRHWGVPSAPHQKGQELYPQLTKFYQAIYALIGAKESDNVIITSSSTEAVNHVISSVHRDVTLATGKNQFLTSKIDEAPAILTISHLEPFSCFGKSIEVNGEGIITADALADKLSPRTALVSLSWVNGLTGVIQPVQEIAALCKQRGVRFHLEATHALGKIDFDLNDIDPDYLTFNGNQLHASHGTGVLFIKQGIKCSPFIYGGSDQAGLRAGSLNMAGLASLATAAEEAIDAIDLLCTETARLRNRLEEGVLKGFPTAKICFKNQERVPHCSTIAFPGISNEALLFLLNRKGLCASIGGGNFQQLALILSACGIDEKTAHGAVSFSLSRETTDDEIDRAIDIITQSAQMLSQLSEPFFREIEV